MNSAIGRIILRLGRRPDPADRMAFVGALARARRPKLRASHHGLVSSVMLCGLFCAARGLAGDPAAAQAKADAPTPAAAKPYVIPADLYVDMETGAPGAAMTVGALEKVTHGVGGTWSLRRGPAVSRDGQLDELVIAPMKPHLTVPVAVGGVTYQSHKGARGWAFDLRTPLRATWFKFSTPHPAVSIGFFLEYHSAPKWVVVDLATIDSEDGDFVVLQTVENTTERNAHVHTGDHWGQGGGSKIGGPIPIEDGKLYWVSMRFVQHGESSLALFDPVTFKQLGPTSTLTLTSHTRADNIVLGRTDNHGVMTPVTMYWDELVVDWTHAVFPLIPRKQDGVVNPVAGR